MHRQSWLGKNQKRQTLLEPVTAVCAVRCAWSARQPRELRGREREAPVNSSRLEQRIPDQQIKRSGQSRTAMKNLESGQDDLEQHPKARSKEPECCGRGTGWPAKASQSRRETGV